MPTLSWLGDSAARRASRKVPYRILDPVETIGDPANENLLIQGDNLDAVKALLPFYTGRVRCIFIDPPYNTKSAFEHYDDNLEHSQWLSMMYPRLELLRELLSTDGSIWITIDDNEAHYLKIVMDEIFARSNFIATIAWQKVFAKKSKAQISGSHDHILVYAKSAPDWRRNLIPRVESQLRAFKNPDSDPRGLWQSVSYSVQSEDSEKRMAYRYAIQLPSGRDVLPPPGRHWNGLPDRTEQLRGENRLWFGKKGNSPPRLKVFLSEVQDGIVPDTWWGHADAGNNQDAKKEMLALFPGIEPFATPKPERLVMRAILIGSSTNDLVLDSFLGSGTTAAVAHKMGRRWIGIEMGDHAVSHCVPRLKKVVDGEQGGISEAVGWKGGGGFRFMKLGAKAFFDDGALNADIKFKDLAAYLWFLETCTPHSTAEFKSPLLGVHSGTAFVLLYNGIIADRRPESGNVLTTALWNQLRKSLPKHRQQTVIYGEACRLSAARLKELQVTFKQIPYDIGIR